MEVNLIDMAVNELSLEGLLAFGREKGMDSFTGEPEPAWGFGAEPGDEVPTERRLLWIEVEAVDSDGLFFEPWSYWDWEY